MEKLFLLVFDLGLGAIYLAIAFMLFMLVQGIVYWTTGFSIYNYLTKKLITEQLKK